MAADLRRLDPQGLDTSRRRSMGRRGGRRSTAPRRPSGKEHGHLFTDGPYGDFGLRLKFKDVQGNSGVYFRAEQGVSGSERGPGRHRPREQGHRRPLRDRRPRLARPPEARGPQEGWLKADDWNELCLSSRSATGSSPRSTAYKTADCARPTASRGPARSPCNSMRDRTWTSRSRTSKSAPGEPASRRRLLTPHTRCPLVEWTNPTEPRKAPMTHPNRRRFLAAAAATAGDADDPPPFGLRRQRADRHRSHRGAATRGRPTSRRSSSRPPRRRSATSTRDVLATAAKLVEDRPASKPRGATATTAGCSTARTSTPSSIATPDHWHALITIHACQAGKDVYCEKPLSLTVAEGRQMVEAARKHERVVQTGTQQRSDDRFRLACELVRSGKIGKIKEVLVGIPKVNFDGPARPRLRPARRARLRLLARPGAEEAVQRQARPLQLPVLLGLLGRPDDQLRRPPPRHRPVGPRHGRHRARSPSRGPPRTTPSTGTRSPRPAGSPTPTPTA